MAINKPDSSINFRFGTLAGYKQATKSPEDIYFVYTPADAATADEAYGVIYVNGIQFGSNVADLAVGGEGVDSSIVFKHLKADGTMENVKMAMISVEEHQHYETIVQQIGSLDGSLLKNINVNGVAGSVANNIASVTIDGDDIKVGGNGAYADSSIDAALAMIDASLQSAISAAGVTSFATKKGDITIKGGSTTNGDVNLSMDGQQLQASIVGLGTAAYEASTTFDASGAAAAVLGTNADTSTVYTVYGARAYAEALAKDASTIAEHTEHGASNGIDVSVTTENGSVKSVTVNAPDFANTYDAKGAANDASTWAKNAMDASFGDLNVADQGTGYVTAVTQSNGKIAVTKSALPDGTFTVKVGGTNKVVFTDNADADASIDFVGGNNITVTEANGVITIAAAEATTPNNGKLTITGNGTTAREFTANQTADTALDISAGSYATVEATTGKITVGVNGTNAVTEGSNALVESGAVWTAINNSSTDLVNKLTVDVVKQATAESGYAATYVIKQGDVSVGAKINIPKDLLVRSAELKTVTEAGEPYPEAQVGDKYIDFEIYTADPSAATGEHIYLPVNDLVDVYTQGNGIEISNTNVVSAKVVTGNGLSVDTNGIAMALATSSSAGAMSAADKAKLDGITDASFNAWNAAQPNKIETIHVNNVAATIDTATKDASVTIDGGSILVGGSGAHASQTVAAAIESAISAAGVTKFGGATGDITVDGTSTTTAGHVTFTMVGNNLTAVADNVAPADVVSGITSHTKHGASNGIDVSVTTEAGQVSAVTVSAPDFANTYVTKTAFDASIDNINSSIDDLQAKDEEIDSSITALKAKDVEIDSSIAILKAKDVEIDSSITAIKEQLMWHTLE